MQFADLALNPLILKAIIEQGYQSPTPIQQKTIPVILKGKDVLGGAPVEQLVAPGEVAARHLLPLLPRDGTSGYVLVGGPGGDYPWAGYGHCSIAAAALRMMVRVLHDEAAGQGVRVQLLALDAPVHTESNTAQAGSAWPKALQLLLVM